jgi:transposase
MKESITVIGCDVHKEKIGAAVLPPAAVRPTEILTIENHPKAIARFVKRLSDSAHPLFVYEAGPCGYELQRQITQLGHKTVVIQRLSLAVLAMG